jgi:hypothetical protein
LVQGGGRADNGIIKLVVSLVEWLIIGRPRRVRRAERPIAIGIVWPKVGAIVVLLWPGIKVAFDDVETRNQK